MTKRKGHALLVVVLTAATATCASPANFALDIYARAGDFLWEEKADGALLLEESGILYAAGSRLELAPTETIWLEGTAEFFGGAVDYDGALQDLRDGTLTPYKSETGYTGTVLGFNVGLRHMVAESIELAPYAGFAARFWRRSLGEGTPHGYDEDWSASHAAAGCMTRLQVAPDTQLRARGELRLALANSTSIAVASPIGTLEVDLEPGERTTVYLEGGLLYHRIAVDAYYETYRFGDSPVDPYIGVFQPRSSGRMVGIKVGVSF